MLTKRLMMNKRAASLPALQRARLEDAISAVHEFAPRANLVRPGAALAYTTILVKGILTSYIDDRRGLRQLVGIHFPGDLVDLHAFSLKVLDHGIQAITPVTVACIAHSELEDIMREMPDLGRKLCTSTLIDAAIYRAWLFRLGRLDAVGRVAHFLSETNARLCAVGLSDGYRFSLGLTQSDLAEICGLTNVHINRVLRQLREEELCLFRLHTVDILDPEALAARGQFDPAYLHIEMPQASSYPIHAKAHDGLALRS